VLQALHARKEHVDALWVGSEAGMEAELVKRESIAFEAIPAAGLHGVGLLAFPRNLVQLARGFAASRRILRDFRPDVLLFTGGYLAGPMAFAGRDIPTMLYVPDIEPGLALRSLARFADCIAVTSAESQKYLSRKVVVTGYPLRSDLSQWTPAKGRAALGLLDDLPVLLVMGGSKGARSINRALVACLPALLERTQIVHITGPVEFDEVAAATASMTPEQSARYQAHPYLHEHMGAALAAADIAVARAGASVLGEFPQFGLPAILVPYPHAWRYQRVNAEYLARHRAAVVIEDGMLQAELPAIVRDLLVDSARRGAMRSAMRELARPEAASALAEQVLELGGHRP
jgi:UDP-N-acetylglucosamine--N-acetylmuramyl-(pentapeptide) pyrophosphoryl-undecaprenol N-acetylglucosamine transferase